MKLEFVKKIVVSTFVALAAVCVQAETGITVQGIRLTYTVSDGKASIGNGSSSAIPTSTAGAITIPSTLGGYPVTSIGYRAFYSCRLLRSITIPDSVTSIGDSAFDGCSSLTSVTIPNSVTSIGDSAFSGCSSLTSVTIPDSVTSIGVSAFYYCRSLTSVTIPNRVTSIGESAFSGCSSLQNIIVDNDNNNYRSIEGLLVSKDGKVFIACPGAKVSVTIPDSVTRIGDCAFSGCSSLTSVTIPASVTSIGDSAFYWCDSLTSVTIPEGVTSIGNYVFKDCSSITNIVIPEGVTSIGWNAFGRCSSLMSVTIPDSVTSIGGCAFMGCDSLTSVTIPDSVTSIGNQAFHNCSSLMSVTIPNSVTSIGDWAFDGCNSLKSVIFYGEVPSGVSASGILSNADSVRYYREYASSYEEIVPASKFGGYLPESVDEFLNMPGNVFTQSDERPWIIDTKVSSDGEGSMRSGKIGVKESTWIETVVNGPGKLTFKWKASSEYYEDKSSGVYEIYDYGYLMVDGDSMGGLDDNSMTNGIAIGGHTDWQEVELDVMGEGEHTLRWTYVKDNYDDEEMMGEDCIWVDQIKFRLMVTLGFDLGGGVGIVPEEIIKLSETVVELPSDDGFGLTDHVFEGWHDGSRLYVGGASYEMPKTNAVLTAMWIAKRFHSFDLNGGVGEVPAVIKDIPGAKITLPSANGFHRDYYTFAGWNDGSETYAANATYTVGSEGVEFTAVWEANTIETPVISSSSVADGGILDAASATITITCDAGATVYYTLDGSTPTASSERYTGAFEVFDLGEVEIKAVALRGNYFDSSVATFTYTRKAYTLAECLNVGSWSVSSVAPAWFRVQGDAAHDGNEALRSGAIGADESSTVEMTVYGEGTFSFWWKVSSHDPRGRKYDHAAFFVGDEEVTWISGEQDWANVTYSITGKGAHTLKWVYKKNGDALVAGEDCAWLDEVVWMGGDKFDITYENLKGATHQNPSFYYEGMNIEFTKPSAVNGYTFTGWTPSEIIESDTGDKVVTASWEWTPQDAVVDATVTGWKPITVKADWAKTELEQKFGAGKKEEFISKFGADLTSAMTKKSGKKDVDGNELLVWHDYVAGTDPTDINSTFKAIIDIEDGKPVISWEPDLNSEGEERVYTVYGKEMLSDIWHSPITALDHFFKVDVAMPREGTVTFNVGGGSSVSPVSIRVGQPIGELPTPTRDGYTFLGWFTASEGGNAVTSESLVTADMTIYARWTIKSYTVVFDANGGSGGVSKSYNHGATLGEMPVPTRDGYTFTGWFTAASGGTQVTANTTVSASMTTVYAQWELTLSGALDIESSGVTVGGNVEWFGQTDISYDAVDSAQSGDISDNQTSWMEVVVKDVSSVSFWWKVSSEAKYDKLHFYVDGTEVVDPISGQSEWIKVEYALAAGSHTLKWSYTKDGGVSKGDDCGWVDLVQTREMVQLWKGGPYWATTNIGAEKPEDYGYYFWWGDTVGYKRENDKWVASDGSNSNFSFEEDNTPTYGKDISTLQSEGWITAEGMLAPEHDAAQVQWGGDCRMPTKQEIEDLNSKCVWTWTTMNGVKGYIVRGKGDYSSKSIFLPCDGYGLGTSLHLAGSYDFYWSSVPYSGSSYAWCLYFNSAIHGTYSYNQRYYGRSVRPVQGLTK